MSFSRTAVTTLLACLLLSAGCSSQSGVKTRPGPDPDLMGTWISVDNGSELTVTSSWIIIDLPSGESTHIRYGVPSEEKLVLTMEGWARPATGQKTDDAQEWLAELPDEARGQGRYSIEGASLEIDAGESDEDLHILTGTYRRP